MNDQDNIQNELNELNSNLPANGGSLPFAVPEGYFDGLAASVLAKIKAQSLSAADELQELSPLLASASKVLPYRLPEGYFTENLMAVSSLIQEEKESPVLVAIGKDLPYTVPENYFDRLPQQVLQKIERPTAKVVPLFAKNWLRAAVAAVVGGVLFTGGYHYFNSAKDPQIANQLPVDTSKNWVAKNESAVIQDIKKASTKELDEFVKTVPVSPPAEKKTQQTAEKGEVKEMLEGVSEKEIDNFLDQLPTSAEDLATID